MKLIGTIGTHHLTRICTMIKTLLKSLFGIRLTRAEYRLKYYEYLQSSKWKKIRAKVLKRDKNRCRHRTFLIFRCKETKGLQIHHRHYRYVFREEKDLSCLVVLCKRHHEQAHKKDKK